MNKIIELRKIISSYLKTKHPRVYFEVAGEDAVFPYVVYDLPNSLDDGSMENFVFDVDGWDNSENNDTTALETLMSAIDGDGDILNPSGLHRRTIAISGFAATFYRENRLTLRDDSPRIRRRKITYQIRTFMGG